MNINEKATFNERVFLIKTNILLINKKNILIFRKVEKITKKFNFFVDRMKKSWYSITCP